MRSRKEVRQQRRTSEPGIHEKRLGDKLRRSRGGAQSIGSKAVREGRLNALDHPGCGSDAAADDDAVRRPEQKERCAKLGELVSDERSDFRPISKLTFAETGTASRPRTHSISEVSTNSTET